MILKPVVLVLGMPGAGKTTCGSELAHELELPFRSMGDVLRIGRATEMLPDHTVDPASAFLSLEILRNRTEFSNGLILDFSPVTSDGERRLKSSLLEEHLRIHCVVFVKAMRRDAEARYILRGQRPGDPITNMQTFFRRRLAEEFRPFTLPMVHRAYELRKLVILDNRGDASQRKREIVRAARIIACEHLDRD